MKSLGKVLKLLGIMALLLQVAGCSKTEQPNVSGKPMSPIGYGGGPGLRQQVQMHDDKCQAIKDKNNDISTLNYELQNAGCTLVDVRTYKKIASSNKAT